MQLQKLGVEKRKVASTRLPSGGGLSDLSEQDYISECVGRSNDRTHLVDSWVSL